MSLPTVVLVLGEKDGQEFPMPEQWNAFAPPPHCWVLPAAAEAEIREARTFHRKVPSYAGTCAYRYCEPNYAATGVIVELVYERDVTADLAAGATVDAYLQYETPC
jgi:hypothetical protein